MSLHSIPLGADTGRISELCFAHLRPPTNITGDPVTGEVTFHFDPDLSAAEATTFTDLIALAAQEAPLTPALLQQLRQQMQPLRDLRQMGRAAFTAQTTAQQLRQLYDAQTNVTTILLALLRES